MKHFKSVVTLMIAVLLLFAMSTVVGAKENKNKIGLVTVNENSTLNIRERASTNAKIIGSLLANDIIDIIDTEDGWYEFTYNDKKAFASVEFVEIITKSEADKIEKTNDSVNSSGKKILSIAKKYLGISYRSAGSSPSSGFDCSGYTSYVYKEFGKSIPRTANNQMQVGTIIKKSDLQPGDLVFFSTNKKTATHVGIYSGNNQIIHSPNSGKTVSFSSLSTSYYSKNYFGARRVVS